MFVVSVDVFASGDWGAFWSSSSQTMSSLCSSSSLSIFCSSGVLCLFSVSLLVTGRGILCLFVLSLLVAGGGVLCSFVVSLLVAGRGILCSFALFVMLRVAARGLRWSFSLENGTSPVVDELSWELGTMLVAASATSPCDLRERISKYLRLVVTWRPWLAQRAGFVRSANRLLHT